jgi:ribonuclease T
MCRMAHEFGIDTADGAEEVLVSVDVEASGPSPGTGSLLALGACLVEDASQSFYRELQPIPDMPWDVAAERVHRLDRVALEEHGLAPVVAMAEFAAWVDLVRGTGRAVFVGFNAPFDWMFVADYCWRFVSRNPFGHAALDLKSLFMGRDGVSSWAATGKDEVSARYPVEEAHTHQALDDARMQAALARRLLHDPR